MALDEALERINALAGLEPGWLNGEGAAIAPATRASAERFLRESSIWRLQRCIAPTVSGGILIEFFHEGWSQAVEFLADGRICHFGIRPAAPEDFSVELDDIDALMAHLQTFRP